MSEQSTPLFVGFEEYLRSELEAEHKSEYVGGTVVAMSGGTQAHNLMAIRLVRLLGPAGDEAGCQLFGSDMKVAIEDHTVYYPDVTVSCEPEDDPLLLRRPCLIAEVLSPSTASIDRREKRRWYQTIPSLQAYLVVDPNAVHIEAHIRNTSGAFDGWDHRHLGPGDVINLACLDFVLDVSELYRPLGVSQPSSATESAER
jgi:Uma2 family endonuclease